MDVGGFGLEERWRRVVARVLVVLVVVRGVVVVIVEVVAGVGSFSSARKASEGVTPSEEVVVAGCAGGVGAVWSGEQGESVGSMGREEGE